MVFHTTGPGEQKVETSFDPLCVTRSAAKACAVICVKPVGLWHIIHVVPSARFLDMMVQHLDAVELQ